MLKSFLFYEIVVIVDGNYILHVLTWQNMKQQSFVSRKFMGFFVDFF